MELQQILTNWLNSLKGWQKELSYRILTKDELEETDIDEIYSMLKSNTDFLDKEFPNIISSDNEKKVRLISINSIQNIEGLAPRHSLDFDKEINMVVVYGSNGSGKSGYTKILKNISGNSSSNDLNSNVFLSNIDGKCVIKYLHNTKEETCEWKINSGIISDLSSIDIFDSIVGDGYLNRSKSVTYTPRCLQLLSQMSHYYSIIKSKLEHEQSLLIKSLPNIPSKFSNTEMYKKYNGLTKNDTEDIFSWGEINEKEIQTIEKKIIKVDYNQLIGEKERQKRELDKIINEISCAYKLVNFDAQKEIHDLRNTSIEKRNIAIESAKIIADNSKLKGVGSKVWKSLWEAAREFSIHEAYNSDKYPNVNNESRCVLCHQLLSEDAKKRLVHFETYITSKLELEASQLEKSLSDKINSLPSLVSKDNLSTKCDAANLETELLDVLVDVWKQFSKVSTLIKQNKEVKINNIYIDKFLERLKSLSIKRGEDILQLEEDKVNYDRESLESQLIALQSKKWCFEQKDEIIKEIERLKKIDYLETLILQCNTRSLSFKVSQISEIVITEEYVKRFNNELSRLNANNIEVELVKSQVSKGIVKHSLKLKSIKNKKVAEILSEGEQRIIALASFLADVTGGNDTNPFIFDDPISSLDLNYEEKVVNRLVELSKTRQVIVFTHRLSLLGQLNEKFRTKEIQIIGIRKEPWGAGEIGETPLFAKKPGAALNKILNDRIPKALNIYLEKGIEEYYPYGKALCSDIRIIVERIVEVNLLADVIQRYRRAVNTVGKIDKLYKIDKQDCDMIDKFMTKYSCYEHSQPNELPNNILKPAEIKVDVEDLICWLDIFKKKVK